MENHPQPHDLTSLAYGLISGPERESLLEHLAGCDDCRQAYDAAFDEQSVVREALVADVRSGAVEARALERTLAAINAQPALSGDGEDISRPVGKLLRMPRAARYALEAAAVILVAAGLFAITQPTIFAPATTGGGDIARGDVPDNESVNARVAPAKVSGVVFAANKDETKWEKTDTVQLGTWLRADGKPVTMYFENGMVCNLASDAVFRFEPAGDKFEVYSIVLRSGDLTLDAKDVKEHITLSAYNDAKFLAAPGSTVSLGFQHNKSDAAVYTVASASSGRLICLSEQDNETYAISVLNAGERVEFNKKTLYWTTGNGPAVRVPLSKDSRPDPVVNIQQLVWAKTQQNRIASLPQADLVRLYGDLGSAESDTMALMAELFKLADTSNQPHIQVKGDFSTLENALHAGSWEWSDGKREIEIDITVSSGVKTFKVTYTEGGKKIERVGSKLAEVTKDIPAIEEALKAGFHSEVKTFTLPYGPKGLPPSNPNEDKAQRIVEPKQESDGVRSVPGESGSTK